MRDPKRIHKFCNQLAEWWESTNPDLRFGQIVYIAQQECAADLFYMDDDGVISALKANSHRYKHKT